MQRILSLSGLLNLLFFELEFNRYLYTLLLNILKYNYRSINKSLSFSIFFVTVSFGASGFGNTAWFIMPSTFKIDKVGSFFLTYIYKGTMRVLYKVVKRTNEGYSVLNVFNVY